MDIQPDLDSAGQPYRHFSTASTPPVQIPMRQVLAETSFQGRSVLILYTVLESPNNSFTLVKQEAGMLGASILTITTCSRLRDLLSHVDRSECRDELEEKILTRGV